MKRDASIRLVLALGFLIIAGTYWLPRVAVDVLFTVLNVACAAYFFITWLRRRKETDA